MQAALITDKEKIEFVEFEPSDPESNQVVVDIIFCGICGTDIHSYQSPGLLGPQHAVTNGLALSPKPVRK